MGTGAPNPPSGSATGESPGQEPPPSTSSQAGADAQIARWRDVIDQMRKRSDVTAKAVGTVGSTVIGAVGIAKFADVFPFVDGWDRSSILGAGATLIGFALVAAALAGITIKLARVSAPVFTSSRLERFSKVDSNERELVQRTFDVTAALNGAPSLAAYEARAHRLERIAQRESDKKRRKELQDRAALIRAEVLASHGRAAAEVIRRRTARSLTDGGAIAWYVAAVIGLMMFAVGADYLDGERSGHDAIKKAQIANDKERVGVAKECAAVLQAYTDQLLTVTLPGACPKAKAATAAEPTAPTAADAAAAALVDLTTQYTACRTAAAAAKTEDDPSCRRILKLINDLSAPE